MGNAVGSPLLGDEYDPVTTEPKGEALIPVSDVGLFLGRQRQLYDQRNTRALGRASLTQ